MEDQLMQAGLFYYLAEKTTMWPGFFFMGLLFFASCSNNSAISKKLSGCDSLVINFTTAIKSVTTTEKKAIKKISQFVNGKKAGEYKCDYTGSLYFFESIFTPLI